MWVKFNDQTPNDPDIDRLSDGAFRLWFAAICHCQAELTDGLVTAEKVRRLVPRYRAAYLTELVKAGKFIPAGPDAYTIHNFTKWNRTRDFWERERQAAAERKAKWVEGRNRGA